MKVTLHEEVSQHVIDLCNTLNMKPQQVIKLLSRAYNNHINKGQPLELQGVIYYEQQKD